MSRPTIQEIAALTARLRELSRAGRDADEADVDRFLADKRELLDRIEADDQPRPSSGYVRSSVQAARELAAEGRPIVEAEAMVRAYLNDVSERVGLAAHEALPGTRLAAESTASTGYVDEEPAAADGFG